MPLGPGVYLFLDKKRGVLYVGKAVSLRRRVLNYFQRNLDPRIREMASRASRIKYEKTGNVLEALILEANLIKKYWPKYNVRDKDDRSFIYIVIPEGDFPKPFISRQREIAKFPQERVFGPYQSLSAIKAGLRIIRKIFPYSDCKINSGKLCFNAQIGLCPGACAGKISKEDYQKNINNLILFLKGEKRKLFKKLKSGNPSAIWSLKHLQDAAVIRSEEIALHAEKLNRVEGYDISHLAGKETFGAMAAFVAGKADKTQYRLFKIKKAPANDDLRALEEMINRRFNHPEWPAPDLILIDGGKPQVSHIAKTLKTRNISIPLVGISKYGGDKLVFPAKLKRSVKNLIAGRKNLLLKVREEAHRFAVKSSRRKRNKRNL